MNNNTSVERAGLYILFVCLAVFFFIIACSESNNPPMIPENPQVDIQTGDRTVYLLTWECSDPEGDPLTYDVYLGIPDSLIPVSLSQGDESYAAAGLEYETIYYWKVTARDDHGNTTDSPYWQFTTIDAPNNAPAVPHDPIPNDGSVDRSISISLSWSCEDPDEDSLTYDVYFGNDSLPPPVSSGQTETTYDPPGDLEYQATYYWRVVSHDPEGESATSSIWSFSTMDSPNHAPDTPSGPNPANNASDQEIDIDLSWNCGDQDGDTLTYDVYFGNDSLPPSVSSGQTETTYDPPGDLEYQATYYWRIVSHDPEGESATSSIWSFSTMESPNHAPDSPSGPNPANNASDQEIDIDLSWNCGDQDGDTLTYDVFFGDSDPPPTAVSNQLGKTFDPEGDLDYSTTYFWKIIARDSHGETTEGPIWSFSTVTNAPPTNPFNPIPPNGADHLPVHVTLAWNSYDADGDPLTFDIYLGTELPPPMIATDYADSFFSIPDSLEPATLYHWNVVARDNHGQTSGTDYWSFSTATRPGDPYNPSPADAAADQDLVTWFRWDCDNPDSMADLVYDVYLDNVNPPMNLIYENCDRSNLIVGYQNLYPEYLFEYNSTYYWKIVAKDSIGITNPNSQVWTFDTRILTGNIESISSYDTQAPARDIFMQGDFIYIANFTDGLYIVDISDPLSPLYAGHYEMPRYAEGVQVAGDYAYIAGGVQNGLLIVNVSDPAYPFLAGSLDVSYNSDIFVSGNYAYISDIYTEKFHIANISDPANPFIVSTFNAPDAVQDAFVENNYAYLALESYGMCVLDISNPSQPRSVSTVPTEAAAIGVYVKDGYAYLSEHTWGGLDIIDISDPSAPFIVGQLSLPYGCDRPFVLDGYAYLPCGDFGIRVADVSDPAIPRLVASYDSLELPSRILVHQGYMYVGDREPTIDIMRFEP